MRNSTRMAVAGAVVAGTMVMAAAASAGILNVREPQPREPQLPVVKVTATTPDRSSDEAREPRTPDRYDIRDRVGQAEDAAANVQREAQDAAATVKACAAGAVETAFVIGCDDTTEARMPDLKGRAIPTGL